MSSSATGTQLGRLSRAELRNVLRRLKAIGRRSNQGNAVAADRDAKRRLEIIEEEHLRLQVARHSALRQDNPALWRELEQDRRARNRETAAINRRLHTEGLRPIELEPSLDQRMKKLQRLEACTRARTATRRTRS